MPLIVLEGLDGAGKSTQLKLLTAMLSERGVEYEYIHFPRFSTPVYGDMIGRFLRGELGDIDAVDPYVVALLFAGDRADAGPMVRAWLDEGKFVILDRYVNSNIAFQCAKYKDSRKQAELKEWIRDTEFVQFAIPQPDLSLFLDVPLQFVGERLAANRDGDDKEYLQGGRDIHEESMTFQSAVRDVYLQLATEDDKLKVIDCSAVDGATVRPEDIFAKVRREIEVQFPML